MDRLYFVVVVAHVTSTRGVKDCLAHGYRAHELSPLAGVFVYSVYAMQPANIK